MFTPSRFIAIDNKKEHLAAIVDELHKLGSSCIGIHYDVAQPLNPDHFKGVRALFLDLHLNDDTAGSDNRRHFGNIAALLETNIGASCGPYILVIWTEHPHLQQEFSAYLDTNLDVNKPHARPLAILCLSKGTFINLADGSQTDGDLRTAIQNVIAANPQMAALLNWETEVMAAAGSTLASLITLIDPAKRSSSEYSGELDTLLSRLAREAVGKANVSADPRAAINSILAPILADRVSNQPVSPAILDLWNAAITKYTDGALGNPTAAEAGIINRMLHIALPLAENIRPFDLGTVVPYPTWSNENLKARFGITTNEAMDAFSVAPADRPNCRPRLVRIGAVCDHAQNKKGPLTYLLGMEIPSNVTRLGTPDKRPLAEWASPVFSVEGLESPFILYTNARFAFNATKNDCAQWQPNYRLRGDLTAHLTFHANTYVCRPGFTSFRS